MTRLKPWVVALALLFAAKAAGAATEAVTQVAAEPTSAKVDAEPPGAIEPLTLPATPPAPRLEMAEVEYQDPESGFAAGHRAYLEGNHESALRLFLGVAEKRRAPELFYNIGNCYYKLGDPGRAILYYERALLLDPGYEDARFNAGLVRDQIVSLSNSEALVENPEIFSFWARLVERLRLSSLICAFAAVYLLFFGLLASLILAPRLRSPALATVAALLLLVSATGLGLIRSRIKYETANRPAVLVEPTVEAREGPDSGARKLYDLPAGWKVTLEREAGDWRRIRLPNGLVGWVKARDVEPIPFD